MANETTIPLLPCRSLDDVAPFYQALGFEITYRQERPNPYVGSGSSAGPSHPRPTTGAAWPARWATRWCRPTRAAIPLRPRGSSTAR